MDIKLRGKDRLRIEGNHDNSHFIDIEGISCNEALAVDLYPMMQYIEIRKTEDGFLRMFLFKSKREKKNYNFGYYSDSEIVFSINNVRHE